MAVLLPGLLAAACTAAKPDGQRVVFPDSTGYTSRMPTQTQAQAHQLLYHSAARRVLVVRRHRLHDLQARPLLPQAGEDQLHRRRSPRLAIRSRQYDHDRHQPGQPRSNTLALLSGLRIIAGRLQHPGNQARQEEPPGGSYGQPLRDLTAPAPSPLPSRLPAKPPAESGERPRPTGQTALSAGSTVVALCG